MNKECDLEDTPVNDRFAEGLQAVPPPMIGNYMPYGPDVEIDYSKFTYGPKQASADELEPKPVEYASSDSDSSVETTTSMSARVDNAPKTVSKPKVWTDAPIIEEYESDSDDDSVENVKDTCTPTHCRKVEKQGRNSHTRKGFGYAFARKSCFVCGSFSHLIRDCDFYEKRMAKQAALTKSKEKGNYMPSRPDVEIDYSKFTYGPKLTSVDESDAKTSENATCKFDTSVETTTSMHATVEDAPKVVCEPKVWTDAPIIEEYESDSDDDSVHMTWNKAHLADYQEFKGGSVAFGGSNDKITGKGKIKADRVAERKNRTLIEAARTMLADSFLPTTFWAEAVNTACYVLHREELEKLKRQEKEANDARRKEATHDSPNANTNSTNLLNTVSAPVSAVGPSRASNDAEPSYPDHPSMPHLEDIFTSPSEGIFTNSSYDDEGVVTDFNNLEITINVSPTLTTRIHTIHLKTQILRDSMSIVHTRSKVHKNSKARALVSYIQKQQRNNHKDFQHGLFACFLSQIEPKKISQALEDESWVDAMQEEWPQFQIQKVWILVDLPFGKKATRTKWVYRNKKDEMGVVVRNKARLVAQGHKQEEGIDYDEVFAFVARIEAMRIFLAFTSYMGFIVYQVDMKSAFLYGTINEEVYVTQPPGFVDPKFPNKVYKVVNALYGLHQTLRAWYATLSTFLEGSRYKRGAIDKTLFIKQDKKDIMLVQVKQKEDVKDKEAADVDVHLYRSMIGSLMYLTASKPDIMFAVYACSRFQVTPKTSHLQAVKRIFRYLKGQPKIGLWYPKLSSFNLEAYSDSDYAGVNLDQKSTTGGCQFLDRRLISWQCKKQTIMATSTTEAEYVAAA
nr:putative ribonuclease H-like domain-containing protein [Tanacetum cinerariifolium]